VLALYITGTPDSKANPNISVPPATILKLLGAVLLIPVSLSSVNDIEGAEAEPLSSFIPVESKTAAVAPRIDTAT
jgi:hypothetical protein